MREAASHLIHTPFLDGVSGSHATGMGILGYRIPESTTGWCGP